MQTKTQFLLQMFQSFSPSTAYRNLTTTQQQRNKQPDWAQIFRKAALLYFCKFTLALNIGNGDPNLGSSCEEIFLKGVWDDQNYRNNYTK